MIYCIIIFFLIIIFLYILYIKIMPENTKFELQLKDLSERIAVVPLHRVRDLSKQFCSAITEDERNKRPGLFKRQFRRGLGRRSTPPVVPSAEQVVGDATPSAEQVDGDAADATDLPADPKVAATMSPPQELPPPAAVRWGWVPTWLGGPTPTGGKKSRKSRKSKKRKSKKSKKRSSKKRRSKRVKTRRR
jgi:hypothetical protein